VISAGTRNHFALDLGLDRENPAACLDALTDGVEQRIDLGVIGNRTFVNNASFGAYAEVVRSPAYRDDKRGTTLQILPELLSGHRGATLTVRAGAVTVTGPQAILVSNNAYEMSDIAGLGHRARLDARTLGVVVVTVNSAMGAVGLLGGGGVMVLVADEVVVDADEAEIPVGIDGETVMMPTPVRCAVRPGALRVRVPRDRPGVRPPKPRIDWSALRALASVRSTPAGAERQETLALPAASCVRALTAAAVAVMGGRQNRYTYRACGEAAAYLGAPSIVAGTADAQGPVGSRQGRVSTPGVAQVQSLAVSAPIGLRRVNSAVSRCRNASAIRGSADEQVCSRLLRAIPVYSLGQNST
jgi:hypothetical protein